MAMLVIGVLLFAGVHLVPALAPALKAGLVARLGAGGFKGVFSLLVVCAVALIIFGWRGTQPVFIYSPLPELKHFALGLLLVAFFLMVVSTRKSRLRQWLRHPQLSGVLLWAIAHLLLNGDNRSLLLFAGMGLWAAVEMLAINRRDGVWVRSEPPGWGADVLNLVIALAVVALVIYLHPWLSGMPVV